MKKGGLNQYDAPDQAFLDEVDEFLSGLPSDGDHVKRIGSTLPPTFQEALARKRRILTAQGITVSNTNWGVIAASLAIAAGVVAMMLIVGLNTKIEPPEVSSSPDGGFVEDEGFTFIITMLPDGEAEVVVEPATVPEAVEPDPEGELMAVGPSVDDLPRLDFEAVKEDGGLWFLKVPEAVAAPLVADSDWPRGDIDRFVLATLEENGLAPAPDAERLTLLRRLSYDLTGLPPSRELVERFLHNPSPAAYGSVVDELLATWQFGEHWGRHWLEDVARYDDTMPESWRYREYVIAALNGDKPYDQFLTEQIAGDHLRMGKAQRRAEVQIATGFLAMAGVDQDEKHLGKFFSGQANRQVDLVLRAFGGINVSAASGGDHKYYPITQRDYDSIAGVFRSTQLFGGFRHPADKVSSPESMIPLRLDRGKYPVANPVIAQQREAEVKRLRGLIANVERRMERARERAEGERIQHLRGELVGLKGNLRTVQLDARDRILAEGSELVGVSDHRKPGDFRKIPRGVIPALAEEVPVIGVRPDRSGRLELAQWLTDDRHPLTARVQVNRVWAELFGSGLVRSVDDIGMPGEEPSHPELLDALAVKFVDSEWSMKQLVRTMVMSRTYQMADVAIAENLEMDPDNRLLWRHTPRGMEAEEIRDGVVAIAGLWKASGEHGKRMFAAGEYAPVVEVEDSHTYRSMYLPGSDLAVGERFIFKAAMGAARNHLKSPTLLPVEQQVSGVFLETLCRMPSTEELEWATELVTGLGTSTDPGMLASPVRPDHVVGPAEYLEGLLPHVVYKSSQGTVPTVVSWAMLYHALMKTDEFRVVR